MQYRKLGQTNLQVSEIGWGTAEIGMGYGFSGAKPCSQKEVDKLVSQCLDLGINFIDTAPAYGKSEVLLGKALGKNRDKFILATKWKPGSGNLASSIESSLRNLRTDYIDILELHSPTIDDLKQSILLRNTKVRFFGTSIYTLREAQEAINHPEFQVLQLPYSFLDRRFEKIITLSKGKGIGTVARSIFFRGLLTEKIFSISNKQEPVNRFIINLLTKFSLSKDDLSNLAVQFVLANKNISTALIGTGRVSSLVAAVKSIDKKNSKLSLILKEKFPQKDDYLDLRRRK